MSSPPATLTILGDHLRSRDLVALEDLLWFHGAESISTSVIDSGTSVLIAGFHDVASAQAARTRVGLASMPDTTVWVEAVTDDSWMDEWKVHARPVHIGDALVVWPSWIPLPSVSSAATSDQTEAGPQGRAVVLLDPGRSFGSGAHPSTVLALEALVELIGQGDSVLDLGCGSGVLAIAALHLGAGVVYASDIDPVALEVTFDNALLNGVQDRMMITMADDSPLPRVDVAVANIGIGPLRERLAELEHNAATVILSGLLPHQAAELARACSGRAQLSRVLDGWQAVTIVVNTD